MHISSERPVFQLRLLVWTYKGQLPGQLDRTANVLCHAMVLVCHVNSMLPVHATSYAADHVDAFIELALLDQGFIKLEWSQDTKLCLFIYEDQIPEQTAQERRPGCGLDCLHF